MKTPLALLGSVLLSASLGCAMCASPHVCKYAAYGGIHERVDMVNGRVGSIIDPAASVSHVVDPSEHALPDRSSEMTAPSEPTPADEDPDATDKAGSSDDAPSKSDAEAEANRKLLEKLGEEVESPEMPGIDDIPSSEDLFDDLKEDET